MSYDTAGLDLAAVERLSGLWRVKYGIGPDGVWSDAQLAQALADNDLPPLDTLPGEPRGMMRQMADPSELQGPLTPKQQREWRRVNASHLIAHVMLHNGERCDGCRDW